MHKPIRAIVGRFSFDFSRGALEKGLQKFPVEFLAHISTGADPIFISHPANPKQKWFDSSEVRSCTYDNVDWTSLQPLEPELIHAMRECEAVFMDMVRRLEWKYEVSYEQRKDWYFKHLRFWNDYIQKHQINLYLSAWLPHEIPDIVIYHLCKQKNIPVIYFNMGTERDAQFVEYNIQESAVHVRDRYAQLKKEFAHATDPKDIPVSPEVENRFQALIAPQGEKPALQSVKLPTYWSDLRELLLTKPLHFLKAGISFLTPAGFHRAIRTAKRNVFIKKRNAFYDQHAIDPDLSKPFVYLALHFQPEASTVPSAGVYADQLLIAELLNTYLPDNVLIYVKEHPRESSWLMRSVEYYEKFLSLSKVRIVKRSVDTFALREHCAAVATATGSVGFEALFRGKPVLMFGYRFYQYADGVHHVHTVELVQEAIRKIFEEKQKPSLVQSKLYLKAIDEASIKGTLNPWDRKASRLSDEEHIDANAKAIEAELSRL